MSNLHKLQGVIIERNGAIVTSHNTKETQKQANNGDKGYMLL